MAKDVADDQIRDTNEHVYETDFPVSDDGSVYQVVNNLDQDVSYTVHATYHGDDDWSDEIQIKSASVTSDSGASEQLSDPWDKIRFKVTATNTPTSGNLLIKEHE